MGDLGGGRGDLQIDLVSMKVVIDRVDDPNPGRMLDLLGDGSSTGRAWDTATRL